MTPSCIKMHMRCGKSGRNVWRRMRPSQLWCVTATGAQSLIRYCVKSIAEVVQFLAINCLYFRGDECAYDFDAACDEQPPGLFLRLFDYTLSKDTKLHMIIKHIPRNAH